MPNINMLNTGTGVAAGDSIRILPQGDVGGVPFLGAGKEHNGQSNISFLLTCRELIEGVRYGQS